MPTSKEIRRRIKSATNTKQIIKAMELVSVVKMQKAVNANLEVRAYGEAINNVITTLCEGVIPGENPYFKTQNADKDLVIIISTDRGLCGSLNAKVVKIIVESFDIKNTDFVCVGKKGADLLRTIGGNCIAEFAGIMNNLTLISVLPVIKLAKDEFLSGKYRSVKIAYPEFISTLSQEASIYNFLPFVSKGGCSEADTIIFEPNKETMLTELVEKILESKFWQIMLETAASEHSARMVAMKNANDNAEELIDDLTLSFNQSRQSAITSELAEISAGAMALER